eukprot:364546-Chlamydomonas_euryale.AAC.6
MPGVACPCRAAAPPNSSAAVTKGAPCGGSLCEGDIALVLGILESALAAAAAAATARPHLRTRTPASHKRERLTTLSCAP